MLNVDQTSFDGMPLEIEEKVIIKYRNLMCITWEKSVLMMKERKKEKGSQKVNVKLNDNNKICNHKW